MSVSKYVDAASKAAGIFGFIATIVFALDFYLIFNELATFLKQGGGETNEEPSRQQGEFSDSDSDWAHGPPAGLHQHVRSSHKGHIDCQLSELIGGLGTFSIK